MPVRSSDSPPLFCQHRLQLLWLVWRMRIQHPVSTNWSEQGLSLIECLVAIIIITLTVVAITPPVFLATATRIQSRRAVQANEIAQAEVDRIKTVVERGGYTVGELPNDGGAPVQNVGAPTPTVSDYILSPAICNGVSGASGTTNYPVPVDRSNPTPNPVTAAMLVQVDVNADCQSEYVMQVFRANDCRTTTTPPTDAPDAFSVGVRVYAYSPGQSLAGLRTDRATLALTTGRRDEGAVKRPLATLYPRMARSSSATAIQCAAP